MVILGCSGGGRGGTVLTRSRAVWETKRLDAGEFFWLSDSSAAVDEEVSVATGARVDLDCKQWGIRIFPESVACEWLHRGDVCVTVMPQQM